MEKSDEKELLSETSQGETIKEIEKIYNKLTKKEKAFCDTFKVRCRKNCGTCCEHFNPDITDAEAAYLAYGIIKENKTEEVLLKLKDYQGEQCPLYDKEKFCTVYSYRPLICRLFNCAVSDNKEEKPVFRHCKWNDLKGEIKTEELLKHKNKLVSMEEFGIQIDELNEESEKTSLIQDILPKKMEYLLYLMDELKKEDKK